MPTPEDKQDSAMKLSKEAHQEAKRAHADRRANEMSRKDTRLSEISKEIKRLHRMGMQDTEEKGSRVRTVERGGVKKKQTVTQATIGDEIDRFASIAQQIKGAVVSDQSISDALDSIQVVAEALDNPDLTATERKAHIETLDVAERQLQVTDVNTLPEKVQEDYRAQRQKVQEEIKNFRDLTTKGTQEFGATREFIKQQKDDAMALVIGKLTNNPLFAIGYKLFADARKIKKRRSEEAKGRLDKTRREKISDLEQEKENIKNVGEYSDFLQPDKVRGEKDKIQEYDIVLPLDKNKEFIEVMRQSIEAGVRESFKTATGEAPKVIPEEAYANMFNDREFVRGMADATLQAIKEGDVVVEGADAETFKMLLDTGKYQNELTEKLVEGFFNEEFSEMFKGERKQQYNPSSVDFSSSSDVVIPEILSNVLIDIKSDTSAIRVAVEKLVGTFDNVSDETEKSRVILERADKRNQENERESKRGRLGRAKDAVTGKLKDVKEGFMESLAGIIGAIAFIKTIPALLMGVLTTITGVFKAVAPFARIFASFAKRIFPVIAIFKGVYDAFTGWEKTEGEDLPVRIGGILKDLAGGILSFFSFGLIDKDTLSEFGKNVSDGLFDVFSDGGYIDQMQEELYQQLKKIPIVGTILGVFESVLDWWNNLDILGSIKRMWTGEKKEKNTTVSASVQSAKESGALEGTTNITVKDSEELAKLSKYRLKSILKSQNLADDTRKHIKSLLESPQPKKAPRKTEPVLDKSMKPIVDFEAVKREAKMKERERSQPAQAPQINTYNSNHNTHVTKSVPITSPLDTSARVQSDYL